MEIIRGRLPGAIKVVIYGPEGIGKSTFASQFRGLYAPHGRRPHA